LGKELPADFIATLSSARSGDARAAAELFPLVYDQLRRVASSYFRGKRASHTLQPTALVHEAFLRLAQSSAVPSQDRAHFIAVAATAMRQILIDHARRRGSQKRGGGLTRVTLDGRDVGPTDEALGAGSQDRAIDVLALDAALSRLAALSPRQAQIIELQYFGGLTVAEVAEALGVSKSLIEKEWRRARAWIRSALASPGPGSAP
jgi:RNA polymerase sigma factor (TIGR02999 family)